MALRADEVASEGAGAVGYLEDVHETCADGIIMLRDCAMGSTRRIEYNSPWGFCKRARIHSLPLRRE